MVSVVRSFNSTDINMRPQEAVLDNSTDTWHKIQYTYVILGLYILYKEYN